VSTIDRTMASAWASSSARWSTTPELLGGDDLAGRGLHEGRAAEEDRALVLHDHGLVGHRGDVGAAGGAGAHDAGDLRDAATREVGLVEEDPPEVLAVGKHLVLHRQEGPAGVDEVDAGQPVVAGDGLGAEVLLDRDRVVGAALDGRVVADHHALAAADASDAGDDAGRGDGVGVIGSAAVHAGRGQRAQLEERAARVQEAVDPVAHQELAPVGVLGTRALRPASPDEGEPFAKLLDELTEATFRRRRLAGCQVLGHM
jgi:hypothetical protein